jgi:hypothetical protein
MQEKQSGQMLMKLVHFRRLKNQSLHHKLEQVTSNTKHLCSNITTICLAIFLYLN